MKGIRSSVTIILLFFGMAIYLPAQIQKVAYPEEIRFDTVKSATVQAEKIAETASTFSDILKLNVAGLIAEEMFTGALDVIVPKGKMTPTQISMEKILAVVLYSAGPEYLILKELFLYENRRIIFISGMNRAVDIMAEVMRKTAPVLNKGATVFNRELRRRTEDGANAVKTLGNWLRNLTHGDQKKQLEKYNRTSRVEPSWPYLTFPPDHTVLPQPKDGEWLFRWEKAISTEGICEYEIYIKYRNSRRPIRLEKTPKTFFNFSKDDIVIGNRDCEFMYWRVRAKNCKGQWGRWSRWGTIHVRKYK